MNNEKKKDYFAYAEIDKKNINWIWYPYLARGMVSILQGDPKTGKSFMLIDIMSRITNGGYKPLSDEKFDEGTVIYQNSDDPIEYSLIERFEKQGGDLNKVFCVDESERKLYFKDLSRLENLIKEKKPLLVVIDPVQAYMGNSDINSMGQVRESLMPLKKLAEVYNCSIVLVQHLKKGNEAKAIYKGAGSIDFVGFARSMLMVIKDEDNTNERLLVHTCSNISKEGDCLSYMINDNHLEWIKNNGEVNADNLVANDNNLFNNAKNFILGCLASCESIVSNELSSLCSVGNFSERTFNGARSLLKKTNLIDCYRKDNKVYWCLKSKMQSCKEGGES